MTNKDRAKKFADRYGFDISGQFKDDLLAQLDEACAEAVKQVIDGYDETKAIQDAKAKAFHAAREICCPECQRKLDANT